ncbi:hypothetical protein [Desertivirga brevis]|uniref:hypothetical protein n=1 Tax=Desertivirga brevis TaxID=2810310 RepID=UPI001A960A4D|nr:hypothetical protein [Pedobacter sp. SYSU D00873]
MQTKTFPIFIISLYSPSTVAAETAEATNPAVTRYPAAVVMATGKAIGAANTAVQAAPRRRPIFLTFLKKAGLGSFSLVLMLSFLFMFLVF